MYVSFKISFHNTNVLPFLPSKYIPSSWLKNTLSSPIISFVYLLRSLVVFVVVITPSLPRDRGTARTTIQVYAVNLIEIRLGARWQPISKQS